MFIVFVGFTAVSFGLISFDLYEPPQKLEAKAGKLDKEQMLLLGKHYLYGYKTKIDFDKAILWLDKASEQGSIEASAILGVLYYSQGPKVDYKKATKYFLKAYKAGNKQATIFLSSIYNNRLYEPEDKNLIYELNNQKPKADIAKNLSLIWNATKGNPHAQQMIASLLSQLYENTEKPLYIVMAKNHLTNAADNDFAMSQLNLYNLLYKEKDKQYEAFKWLEKAAKHNEPQALHSLGTHYLNGEKVTQDFSMAAKLFQKAADQGNDKAHMSLAMLHFQGRAAPYEPVKAIYFLQNAVQKKLVHPYILNYASSPYFKRITKTDFKQMVAFGLNIEESLKNSSAKPKKLSTKDAYNVALTYLSKNEMDKGINFLKSAADRGLIKAQLLLADAYEAGIVTGENNPRKAVELSRKAFEDVSNDTDKQTVATHLGRKLFLYPSFAKNNVETYRILVSSKNNQYARYASDMLFFSTSPALRKKLLQQE